MIYETKNQSIYSKFYGKPLNYSACSLNQLLAARFFIDYAINPGVVKEYSIKSGNLKNNNVENDYFKERDGQFVEYLLEDEDLNGVAQIVNSAIEDGFGCVRKDYYHILAAYGILKAHGGLDGNEDRASANFSVYAKSNRYLPAKAAWESFEERLATRFTDEEEYNPFVIDGEI